MESETVSLNELRKIAVNAVNFLREIHNDLAGKISGKSVKEDMRKYHRILDERLKEWLLNHFSSFIWMDHWSRENVGGRDPEIFVVANTSDGTENIVRGYIGGEVAGIGFLPAGGKVLGETLVSAAGAYEINKYAVADAGGKVELRGFRKKNLRACEIEEALSVIEFGGVAERKLVLNRLGKLLEIAGKVTKPACFTLHALYTALGNLDLYIDVRDNNADVSHFPAAYLFVKHLPSEWVFWNGKEWKSIEHVRMEAGLKVMNVIASSKTLLMKVLKVLNTML